MVSSDENIESKSGPSEPTSSEPASSETTITEPTNSDTASSEQTSTEPTGPIEPSGIGLITFSDVTAERSDASDRSANAGTTSSDDTPTTFESGFSDEQPASSEVQILSGSSEIVEDFSAASAGPADVDPSQESETETLPASSEPPSLYGSSPSLAELTEVGSSEPSSAASSDIAGGSSDPESTPAYAQASDVQASQTSDSQGSWGPDSSQIDQPSGSPADAKTSDPASSSVSIEPVSGDTSESMGPELDDFELLGPTSQPNDTSDVSGPGLQDHGDPVSSEPGFSDIYDAAVDSILEYVEQPSDSWFESGHDMEESVLCEELVSTFLSLDPDQGSGPEQVEEISLKHMLFSSPPSYKEALLIETAPEETQIIISEPTLSESFVSDGPATSDPATSEPATLGLKRQRTVKEIAVQAIEENLDKPISEVHMSALEKFVETIVLNVAAERHEDLDHILREPDIQNAIQFVIQEITQ